MRKINDLTVFTLLIFDVVVVGLGPAGAAFSYFISNYGLKVLSLEKNNKLALKPCGELIPRELLSILNIRPNDVDAYPIKRAVIYFYYKGKLVEKVLEFASIEGFSINKRLLLEILTDNASAQDIKIILGKPVLDLNKNGSIIAKDVGKVRANLIICCDGINGISIKYFKPQRLAATLQRKVKNVRLPYDEAAYALILEGVKGYGWIIPKSDGTCNVGFGALNVNPRPFIDKMSKVLTWLNSYKVIQEAAASIPLSGLRDNIIEGKLIALGDVAGSVFPISGEGIRPSIVMAKYLAQAVGKAIIRDDPSIIYEGLVKFTKEWGYRIKRSLLYLKIYERMPSQLFKQLFLRVTPNILRRILDGEFTGAILKFG